MAKRTANPRGVKQFTAETRCSKCGGCIGAEDDRVSVMVAEMKPDAYNAAGFVPAGRGDSFVLSFCSACIAEMPDFTFRNPWKTLSDCLAHPCAGPASEDVMFKARSLSGMAADRAAREQAQDNPDARSAEEIEAALYSTKTRTTPCPGLPTEDDLRERMIAFLLTSESNVMPKQLRLVASKWSSGETQAQIAKATGMNQSTVSRWLEDAKRRLYHQPKK